MDTSERYITESYNTISIAKAVTKEIWKKRKVH